MTFLASQCYTPSDIYLQIEQQDLERLQTLDIMHLTGDDYDAASILEYILQNDVILPPDMIPNQEEDQNEGNGKMEEPELEQDDEEMTELDEQHAQEEIDEERDESMDMDNSHELRLPSSDTTDDYLPDEAKKQPRRKSSLKLSAVQETDPEPTQSKRDSKKTADQEKFNQDGMPDQTELPHDKALKALFEHLSLSNLNIPSDIIPSTSGQGNKPSTEEGNLYKHVGKFTTELIQLCMNLYNRKKEFVLRHSDLQEVFHRDALGNSWNLFEKYYAFKNIEQEAPG